MTPGIETYLHNTQDSDRHREPEHSDHGLRNQSNKPRHLQDIGDRHVPEHLRQLRMRKRERPETEVRGCVGDTTQTELNCMDDLMHDHLAEIVLLLRINGKRTQLPRRTRTSSSATTSE